MQDQPDVQVDAAEIHHVAAKIDALADKSGWSTWADLRATGLQGSKDLVDAHDALNQHLLTQWSLGLGSTLRFDAQFLNEVAHRFPKLDHESADMIQRALNDDTANLHKQT